MKKITRIMMLIGIASLFAAVNSTAQIIVRVRPHPPVVVERPVAPSPRHVWVSEEWTPRRHDYAYREGHWALPPHPRAIWVPGHWADRRGGSFWVAGHWR